MTSIQTENERADAEAAISSALKAMGGRDMDTWESDAMSHAIIAFHHGAYRLARADCEAATLPVNRRSPEFRAAWSHTKKCLARQWENARRERPEFRVIKLDCCCETDFGKIAAR